MLSDEAITLLESALTNKYRIDYTFRVNVNKRYGYYDSLDPHGTRQSMYLLRRSGVDQLILCQVSYLGIPVAWWMASLDFSLTTKSSNISFSEAIKFCWEELSGTQFKTEFLAYFLGNKEQNTDIESM